MTQTVVVQRILPGGLAEVSLKRASACAHDCKDCAGCGAPQEIITITAENSIGATIGEHVVVESGTRTVLSLAALTYLMPLVLFFLGYALGAWLAPSWAELGGCLAFALGILLLFPLNKWLKQKKTVFYTVIERDQNVV